MKAMDLLRQSQEQFTMSDNLSVSESISYLHAKTFVTETTNAFISYHIYNDRTKNIRTTEAAFNSVKLDSEPQENDEITYDSKTYRVRDWIESQGRYIINTTHKQHHTGKRIKIR